MEAVLLLLTGLATLANTQDFKIAFHWLFFPGFFLRYINESQVFVEFANTSPYARLYPLVPHVNHLILCYLPGFIGFGIRRRFQNCLGIKQRQIGLSLVFDFFDN